MSKKITLKGKMPKRRNPLVVDARTRKAGAMKDRRAERGGTKNKQQEILKDYDDEE